MMSLCKKPGSLGTLESILTALIEDEALWGNLTDDERKACLAWAERRLSEGLSRERVFVRDVLSTLNGLMGRDPLDRGDVLRAMLGE